MRARSLKLQRAMRIYRGMAGAFLDAHPLCQRCEQAQSTEVHHKAGRVGSALLDDSRWAALCRACHHHVTVNPQEAIDQGWSLRRVGEAR